MFERMTQGRRVLVTYYIGMLVGMLIVLSVMIEAAADRQETLLVLEADEAEGRAAKWHGLYRHSLSEKQTLKASAETSESDTSAVPGNE